MHAARRRRLFSRWCDEDLTLVVLIISCRRRRTMRPTRSAASLCIYIMYILQCLWYYILLFYVYKISRCLHCYGFLIKPHYKFSCIYYKYIIIMVLVGRPRLVINLYYKRVHSVRVASSAPHGYRSSSRAFCLSPLFLFLALIIFYICFLAKQWPRLLLLPPPFFTVPTSIQQRSTRRCIMCVCVCVCVCWISEQQRPHSSSHKRNLNIITIYVL